MDMNNPTGGVLDALKSLIGMANAPEKVEPGPGDVGPSLETKDTTLVSLDMTEEQVGEWLQRIDRAKQRRDLRAEKWDLLLKEYLPIVEASNVPENVKVMGHFRNVHSRIGSLFFRSPDLILTPKEPSPAQNEIPNPAPSPSGKPQPPFKLEDIISVKQAVLNMKLGRDGIKFNRLIDELLFDVLAWAGIGCAKIGYRCVIKMVEQPKMGPPPVPQVPGSILGLSQPQQMQPLPPVPQVGPDGQPMMESVPVPIYEEYYARRFSPRKWLVDDLCKSTRYDEDATWQGMEFYMSPSKAVKAFDISEEEANKAAVDETVYKYDEDSGTRANGTGLVHGYELWVKASVYTDELHPEAMCQLVFIEGIKDRPVVWRPSPDQEFDDMGKLTDDSVRGFPIRVLTIRDLADSCFPPADSAFTNSEIKQLSTYRRQGVMLRDAQIGKYLYNKDAFDENEVKILKDGQFGEMVGVAGDKFIQGVDKVINVTPQVHGTADNYRGAADLKQDINETLAQSAVNSGTTEDKVHSATEISAVRSGAAARNNKELMRVVDFYLDCARMVDQLLMRYADQDEYVHIAGDEGERRMMVWNKSHIMGKYLYDIAPDSQLQIDTAVDFQQTLQYYNVTAKDPMSNRLYVLRRLARMRGFDPSRATVDPSTLPEQKAKPEPPKITLSLSGEDLQIPAVREMLIQMGVIEVPPEMRPLQGQAAGPMGLVKKPQPPHGGANPTAEAVSQHMQSNSGGMQNAPGSTNHRESQVK